MVFNRNVDTKKVKLKNRKQHFGKKKAKKMKAANAGAPGTNGDTLAAIGKALADIGEELKTLKA